MTRSEIKDLPMTVVPGFPAPDEVARLWSWLQMHPEANFDDFGPTDFQSFYEHLRLEYGAGVEYFTATVTSLGAVGVFGLKLENGLAHFHGLCFADYVHRTGVPTKAVREALTMIFRERICRKVVATIFASNVRARSFFDGLGFRSEGFFRNETMQKGCPIHVERLALLAGRLTAAA